jgi:hypothetical protein
VSEAISYSSVLWGNASNAAIPVPREVVAALGGGGRARLVVTVNGFEFTRELGSMGGEPMIGFSHVRRRESGIQPGDEIHVTLALAE